MTGVFHGADCRQCLVAGVVLTRCQRFRGGTVGQRESRLAGPPPDISVVLERPGDHRVGGPQPCLALADPSNLEPHPSWQSLLPIPQRGDPLLHVLSGMREATCERRATLIRRTVPVHEIRVTGVASGGQHDAIVTDGRAQDALVLILLLAVYVHLVVPQEIRRLVESIGIDDLGLEPGQHVQSAHSIVGGVTIQPLRIVHFRGVGPGRGQRAAPRAVEGNQHPLPA